MFHFNQITSLRAVVSMLIIGVYLVVSIGAGAAVIPGTDLSTSVKGRKFSAALSEFMPAYGTSHEITLDWRMPEGEIVFDMPDGDYVSEIGLSLSALPDGNVDKSMPLMVQFNSGKAVPVRSRGRRFEANIRLNPKQIRGSGNTLRFSYGGSEDCSEASGKWIIDAKRSRLNITAGVKRGGYQIGQIEPRLAHPMTAPRSVSIIAKGADSLTLEALAAQGIGLRMDTIPDFKLAGQSSDIRILIGTRAALGNRITDDTLRSEEGGFIGVQTRAGRAEIVISAPDSAQTLAIARAFARYHLPRSRRKSVSIREMDMQLPFIYEVQEVLNGTRKLHDIAPVYFDAGYDPKSVNLDIMIENGATSQGEIVLGLKASNVVSKTSRVSVALNGRSLGFTNIDKMRKRVAFSVPAGQFNSGQNTVTLTPLMMADNGICASNVLGSLPHIQVLGSSSISVMTPPSAAADLGAIGSGKAALYEELGAQTDIILTSQSAQDRAAALGILAKLAQSSGYGLINARIYSDAAAQLTPNRHALVLGPVTSDAQRLLSGAPRALRDALRGSLTADTATIVAGADSQTAFNAAANNVAKNSGSTSQGVAALYRAQSGSAIISVFSASSPKRFASLSRDVVKQDHWQSLSGGVSVWTSKSLKMVQAADRSVLAPSSKGLFASAVKSPLQGFQGSVADFNAAARLRVETLSAKIKNWKREPQSAPTPLEHSVSPRPAPLVAKLPTPKVSAPKISANAVAPPLTAYRQRPAFNSPQLRTASRITPQSSVIQPVTQSVSRPKFSVSHLQTTVAHDIDSAKNFMIALKPKRVNTATRVQSPDLKASLPNFQTSDIKFPEISMQSLQSKGVLLALVSLMALMMLGLARPMSSNKNIS